MDILVRHIRMLKLPSVVLVALTLVGSRGHAQELDYIFVESPTLHPLLVQVPDAFERDRMYSAVVALHGFGGTPGSFLEATQDIARAGYILASVGAPYRFLINDSMMGYDWSYRHLSLAAVSERASQLRGAFAYLTTSAHPEVVDGLIALGSRFDAAWFQGQGGDSNGFPVFIGHGERESEQSVARARAARDYLQTAGYDVTFRTFDVGHAVPREMVAAIIEWLRGH